MSQNKLNNLGSKQQAAATVLKITPNCSLSPSQAKTFMMFVGISMLLVSGSIALAGFWLVLPFAGLEMLVLGVAVHVSMKRGQYQEVLHISDECVIVEKGKLEPQERVEFPRYWTTSQLVRSQVSAYPSKLLVTCQGKALEIGACLTESERLGLGARLKTLLGPVGSSSPSITSNANR